jgi:hypothetical protein
MNSRAFHVRTAPFMSSVILFSVFVSVANAYPIGGTPPASTPPISSFNFDFNQGLQSLFTPFESFFQSVITQEHTTINIQGLAPSTPDPNSNSSSMTSFQYLSQALTIILNGLSSMFGYLKQGTDWLKALISH